MKLWRVEQTFPRLLVRVSLSPKVARGCIFAHVGPPIHADDHPGLMSRRSWGQPRDWYGHHRIDCERHASMHDAHSDLRAMSTKTS